MANADVLEEVEQLDEFYERRPRSSVRRYNGGQPRPAQADAESSNTRFPARASEMARRTTGSHEMQEARTRAYQHPLSGQKRRWWMPAATGLCAMAMALSFLPGACGYVSDRWTYGNPEEHQPLTVELGIGDSKERPSIVTVNAAGNGVIVVTVVVGGSEKGVVQGYVVGGIVAQNGQQIITEFEVKNADDDEKLDIVITQRVGYGSSSQSVEKVLYNTGKEFTQKK